MRAINCEIGLDDPWNYVKQRYVSNMLEFADIQEPVMCVGFTYKLYEHLAQQGEFDFSVDSSKVYSTIFIVDVIESALNPLKLLEDLKVNCDSETKIYITCPYRYNSYFWNWNHWHEIDPRRFEYLADQAGFQITRMMKRKIWQKWWWYFKGVRTILRLLLAHYNHYYYELRLK